jgi:hypothetical protein
MENNHFEGLTPEELVEAAIFPSDLNPEETKAMALEMRELRMSRLAGLTEEEKTYANLVRLRIQMERYLLDEANLEIEKSFGFFLKIYQTLTGRNQRALALDLGVHHTKLNRLLNDHDFPNLAFIYRLEKHSGKMIPALLWWKTANKKTEFLIHSDKITKIKEGEKVSNGLHFQFATNP